MRSLEEIKKISPTVLLKLIHRAKKFLKTNPVMIDIFKEYSVDISIIDHIPIYFADIPVSARTDKGVIYLNYKLLADNDFFKDIMYLVHEITHYLQQCYGTAATQGAEDGDYLKNPYEIEGFQRQLEYIDDTFGKDQAEDYAEQVLDHHDVDDKEDRQEKKDSLLKLVEEKEQDH